MLRALSTYQPDRGGSLLVVTVWAIFLLGMLAIAVSRHVSVALDSARRLSARMEASRLAQAGVLRSAAVLMRDTNSWDSLSEMWASSHGTFKDVELEGGTFSISHEVVQPDGIRIVLGEERA